MAPENDRRSTVPGEIEEILRRIGTGPDSGFDLSDGALALAAADRPGVAIDRYRRHFNELARDVARAYESGAGGATGIEHCVGALNKTILGDYRYRGDTLTYDDLQNANLMRVIDRRKGLPIALGIFYLHAGRAQGWPMTGLGFPGHFLVRLDHDGERSIVDPFNNGQVCSADDLRALLKAMQGAEVELRPEHYAPVSDREILLRLQNNVKLRLVQLRKIGEAAAVAETMLLFAPAIGVLWRDAGLLHAQAGNLQAAISALDSYVLREPRDGPRHEAAAVLQQLRQRLN